MKRIRILEGELTTDNIIYEVHAYGRSTLLVDWALLISPEGAGGRERKCWNNVNRDVQS